MTISNNSCANKADCKRFEIGTCLSVEEECFCDVFDSTSSRPSLYDPRGITDWCELSLTGECPLEKRLVCIKKSHDVCLTGKYLESREHWERVIEEEVEWYEDADRIIDFNFSIVLVKRVFKSYPSRLRRELPPN
jgi:hypothetical protein